jgi:hypothetical protein
MRNPGTAFAIVVALAGAAASATAGPAAASQQVAGGTTTVFAFGERRPLTATDLTLQISYRDPDDPDAKPPAVRSLVIDAPPGTRFDAEAVPVCRATDEELRVLGRAACPAGSVVATGTLTAVTGLGPPIDPFVTDAVVFNGGSELIETFSAAGTDGPLLAIDRVGVSGSRLTGNPPAVPGGPPDGNTAVRDIDLRFARNGFVVTPDECPADGLWRTNAFYGFADGTSQTASSTTPCEAVATAGPAVGGGAEAAAGQQATSAAAPFLPRTGGGSLAVPGALAILAGAVSLALRSAGARTRP